MYEATFSIRDSGPYTESTREADCRIELWCNEHADLLYVSGPAVDPVTDRVESEVGLEERLDGTDETLLVTSSCLKANDEATIETYMRRNNCLLLPPIRYENGRKICRILALDSRALTDVYEGLHADELDVDVRSKGEIRFPTSSSQLFGLEDVVPDLTSRQRETLLSAVENGYYELPRETTTDALAAELGISRRTAEDHLRRAERKLITSLATHIS
ncbi:transcriptional regulator [Natrarchaeobius chitinivorans]|uniref:Transcriptional regulator n=1 Tax=Natrarchaeobius chitinivorans TaxID=1679083 RepID=A0A3N6LX04_NATCH|nr:helix-turn-helix domain-containing protein [Natrarchaeobius chitinivorans]RQG93467.1 transcriptional regulator [Natrarchaeobius chitinivorans]